jgi:hypothetical protein
VAGRLSLRRQVTVGFISATRRTRTWTRCRRRPRALPCILTEFFSPAPARLAAGPSSSPPWMMRLTDVSCWAGEDSGGGSLLSIRPVRVQPETKTRRAYSRANIVDEERLPLSYTMRSRARRTRRCCAGADTSLVRVRRRPPACAPSASSSSSTGREQLAADVVCGGSSTGDWVGIVERVWRTPST